MRARTITLVILLFLATTAVTDAQQAGGARRVGLLTPTRPNPGNPLFVAFQQRLRDLGYIDGQNVILEWRGGPFEQLPSLAAEVVNLKVDVIVAWGTPAVAALKQRTTAIPIVMASAGDAVRTGLVASLARPGGNVTGVSFQAGDLVTKRVELIRDVVPGASRIGVLLDSTDPAAANARAGVAAAMKVVNLHFELVEAPTLADLDKAFATLRRTRVDGVVIMPSTRYINRPGEVAQAALAHRLVTVFGDPESVKAGGLMAYTVDWLDMTRTAANYVDRILKGAKAADLPIEQPTKFELVINHKTARALGVTIPASVLLRADRVIE